MVETAKGRRPVLRGHGQQRRGPRSCERGRRVRRAGRWLDHSLHHRLPRIPVEQQAEEVQQRVCAQDVQHDEHDYRGDD